MEASTALEITLLLLDNGRGEVSIVKPDEGCKDDFDFDSLFEEDDTLF